MSDEILDVNTRNAADYSEDSIRHLDDMTHIRMRPGMYIGRLGDGSHAEDGIYVLLKESIDNSIDEFNEGFGKKIEVEITDELTASIRDYGRGIPLGSLIPAVSQLNTGGKYDNDQYTASVGLNGVGLKAVNALSRRFVARACRDGQFREATFEVDNFTITLKGKDVGTDTVEEPTVVADDNRTTGQCLKTFLQGTECIHVDIIGRLIEEEDITFLLQCHSQLKTVALTTREY